MLLFALAASGALTLFAGSRGDAWVFDLHDAVSVAITAVLVLKLRRVWPRLRRSGRSDRRTMVGLIATLLAAGGLASGFLWSDGATLHPASFSLLAWHEASGGFLVVVVAVHMVWRARRLRSRDLQHRRQFVMAGGIAIGSFVAWQTQRPFQALFEL